MSQHSVAAITNVQTDPTPAVERYRAQLETVDMRALDAAGPGGGAAIQPQALEPMAPSSAMNLQSLAGQFSDGLQHGFYSADIDRLMNKLVQAREPGSGVTFGDVTVELLNVQAKVGIADAFSKVSSKLAEGLQTMVVRQG
jgi:hypothetical protein